MPSARTTDDKPLSRSGDRKAHEDGSSCRKTGTIVV